MLHTIIFQDNLFQLTRMLDVIKDGMNLDLSRDIFGERIISDILFFDSALHKLFDQIEPQTHLPDYIDSMHCLYFCISKYMRLLQTVLAGKRSGVFLNGMDTSHFENILNNQKELIDKIGINLSESDVQSDSYTMVSQNELSELLNFN